MNRGSILITDGVHPLMIEKFESAGFKCAYHPKIGLAKVRAMIKDYEGLIINSKILVDKAFIEAAPKLKFIGRLGSGMEIVDVEYAQEKGIFVHRAPEGNRNAVAEHGLGMLLALMNKFRQGDRQVREFYWNREENRGVELMGLTVGIWGFGHTGQAFAQKLSGMGVKVLAYDKYTSYFAKGQTHLEEVTPQRIFDEADILSLHVPLTEETHHLVNQTFINRFKKPFILLNTSRGKAVNTNDLIIALRTGKIIGACLDVFENEKPTTFTIREKRLYEQLYELDNVLLTPHVAGWTVESKKRLAQVLIDKIFRDLRINIY